MKNNITAKRYANSLIKIAQDNKLSFEEIELNLNNIKTILDNSKDLNEVMTNPIISLNDKKEIANIVFEKDVNPIIKNFLILLIEKNRFELIYDIIKSYFELIDELKNIIKVEVISAIELDENKKNRIATELSNKLQKEIKLSYQIDDSIIAGLIFKIDDNILDTSLAHKLNEIEKAII